MRCDETDMTWLGQMTDFTDVYATVSGKESLITEEGYSGKNTHLGLQDVGILCRTSE